MIWLLRHPKTNPDPGRRPQCFRRPGRPEVALSPRPGEQPARHRANAPTSEAACQHRTCAARSVPLSPSVPLPCRTTTISRRSAYTLLEIILASSMLTIMATAAAVILRGSQMAWLAHESDLAQVEEATAALRHVVRHVRQAQSVDFINPERQFDSRLTVVMPDGQKYTWLLYAPGVGFRFATGSSGLEMLGEHLSNVSFIGYERDTVTKTSKVADIRLIEVRVTIQRARGPETYSCRAWLRSW